MHKLGSKDYQSMKINNNTLFKTHNKQYKAARPNCKKGFETNKI